VDRDVDDKPPVLSEASTVKQSVRLSAKQRRYVCVFLPSLTKLERCFYLVLTDHHFICIVKFHLGQHGSMRHFSFHSTTPSLIWLSAAQFRWLEANQKSPVHFSYHIFTRAAGRLKFLILVHLGIIRKKTVNVYQLLTTAHVISLKRKTIISQTVCAVTL